MKLRININAFTPLCIFITCVFSNLVAFCLGRPENFDCRASTLPTITYYGTVVQDIRILYKYTKVSVCYVEILLSFTKRSNLNIFGCLFWVITEAAGSNLTEFSL